MLVDLKRIVAYICPFCSNISTKSISIFNFSGTKKVSLICPTHGCHETCVTITPKNAKYKLDIECPLCGGTHSYTVKKEAFWQKPFISYKCPSAGIDTFFIGERQTVEQALEEYSDIYSDVFEDFDDVIQNESLDLIYMMVEHLHTLQDKHLISCICGSENIEMNVENNSIVISCSRCGRSKKIEVTEDSLMRILNTSALIISD